jgi:hypothetical protein
MMMAFSMVSYIVLVVYGTNVDYNAFAISQIVVLATSPMMLIGFFAV